MISIAVCCHGAKLCAHAARDFQSQQSQGFLTRGNLTYPGGKFNDAVVHFSKALVSKQKTRGEFYVKKMARGKRE